MFLSSLIKTQSKSNALSTALSTSSKNHLNSFLKFQVKHVSRSLTSRENREKYDLKKMDDYWETVEQEFNRRMEIAKQVEEKYKTKSESFIAASKQSATEVKEIYFVPLTKSDETILKDFFKAEVLDDIRKGGRLVLLDEVRKYNKAHPFARIEMDFEPLDAQDFEKIKKNFNFLLSEKEFFVVALQQGKKIFEFLDAFKKHKADLLSSLNAAFRRVEHLEAIEASHPLKNNLSVSLRKIENPQWIKNLLLHNKIDQKILSEKFNKIYFEYLDCLNSAAAASRGYDIELFEDGAEHKKALEAAKKETKDKLAKITAFLDSIDFEDGKVIEISAEVDKKKSVDAVRKGKEDKTEAKDEKLTKSQSEKETESENKTKINDKIEDTEVELDEENERVYKFDPEKDYSKVFEKNEKDLTFDEYEYIRFCNDEEAEAQYALLNASYAGRLVLKLVEAEQALSAATRVLEKNSASIVYATENLIKSQEIDGIINELKSLKTLPANANANKKFTLQKKLDLENEDNLLKLANNPRAFLQNLYWDHVKSAVQDKALKIPVTVHDKETYVFRVLLKYFADVIQSKNQQFNEKNSRLDYFGENLKSYQIWEKSATEKNSNLEEADEEKANPENFFTPNFKKLIDFLNKEHGLIEKSVFDYKFNIEGEGFKYPLHVMDLSAYLPSADGLGKEVLRFYLEHSNEKNLLNDKDEEKVFSYVAKHLAEVQETLQQEDQESSEETKSSFAKYKPSSYYSNILERNLYDRIQAYMEKAANSNLFFKAIKSSDLKKLKSAKAQNQPQTVNEPSGEIIESILVKGVYADRSLNNRPDAYLLLDNQEDLGLKYYMHKSLKGIHDYNLEDPYLSSFNDDTLQGNLNDEKIKLIKTRDNKLVLRVYYQISDSSRLMLLDGKSKDLLASENTSVNNNKTQKHFLVFENELKSPNNLALLNKSFESWLASHEIDMGNWKLVDADNFMKGNSFFYNKTALEAQLNEGVNSLEELGAALNGYFHEENFVSVEEAPETQVPVASANEAEKESKTKKDAAAAAAPKEKSKKEGKEPKQKDKEGGKGKKGEKADKADKADKGEKAETKAVPQQQPQKLTQLNSSYKINYLFDLKDSQELKKFNEDAKKINELFDNELQRLYKSQLTQKKEINEIQKKMQEKSQVFFDRLMEYIEIENQAAHLDNEDLISLMESKDVSKDLKKGYEELTSEKSQLLKGLIDSYRQISELTSKSPAELKKTKKIYNFAIDSEEQTEEKPAEKTQVIAKGAVVSEEEKVQKMISSHMSSLFKKYDLEKIQNANRIKI